MQELLQPYPDIAAWMKRVSERTAPHYGEVSALLRKAAKRFKQDRDKQLAENSTSKL